MDSNCFKDEHTGDLDWWRISRYFWRLPLLLSHIFAGLSATVLTIVLVGDRIRIGGESLHHVMIRWWSGLLCRIFGVRIESGGQPAPGPVMMVANHVSWLDIEVIQARRAAGFVAKAEIRSWPFIGWIASLAGTVFLQRGSGNSSGSVIRSMQVALLGGATIAIFPEGRAGRGDRVLPFHGRLLQAAIEADCAVQPVAIRYTRNGQKTTDIAFAQGESFMGNLWRLLGDPPTAAEVQYLPPIIPVGQGRRETINQARDAIIEVVERNE